MEGSLHPEQLALVVGSDHRQLLVGKRIGACRLWSTDLLDCRSWSVGPSLHHFWRPPTR